MDRLSSVICHLPLAILLALAGCARVPVGDAPFTVATAWSEAERSDLERAFARWLKANSLGDEPVRINWMPLSPGDDLTRLVPPSRKRLVGCSRPLDVVLGGPATDYVRLERLGRLVAVDRPGRPHWCVARQGSIETPPPDRAREVQKSLADPILIDDPRHDPVALAWAKRELADARRVFDKSWDFGYAELVRTAAKSPRIERQPGASRAAIEHGTDARTPVARPVAGTVEHGPLLSWIEGVAIVNGGDNPAIAQRFLKFLAERDMAGSPPEDPGDAVADALLADLLGATLVDAQDELWTAWKAVKAASEPETPIHWMTQPPPWPPASVAKLVSQDKSGALLETLAAQMAPDADVRAWLVRSWLGPPRLIDDRLLAELGRAAGGKLVREPRFRAWLRGEWTAWARQRYRRVARLVGSEQGVRP